MLWLFCSEVFKPSCLYHCSRPSAVECSLGCLLRQGVFPLIGQHAEGLPVPLCVHMLLPGGLACGLCSLAPGSWRCAEAKPPRIPRDQSLPEDRKTEKFLLMSVSERWETNVSRSLEKKKHTRDISAANNWIRRDTKNFHLHKKWVKVLRHLTVESGKHNRLPTEFQSSSGCRDGGFCYQFEHTVYGLPHDIRTWNLLFIKRCTD